MGEVITESVTEAVRTQDTFCTDQPAGQMRQPSAVTQCGSLCTNETEKENRLLTDAGSSHAPMIDYNRVQIRSASKDNRSVCYVIALLSVDHQRKERKV
ncbi:hypothetical protein PGT21_015694 [Puccinia graminis f. sp. tritici]|uniref:Uncharacterized protein n=1 Tax=Puccinia graminis f. sp. tritici TaxID=56615 RepID=A0A5B0PTU6_PUCGR|nr:hypothetical protein PGT21_015694 [Puccinia graminis f. sp. tritici]